jgi:hypothetical protein
MTRADAKRTVRPILAHYGLYDKFPRVADLACALTDAILRAVAVEREANAKCCDAEAHGCRINEDWDAAWFDCAQQLAARIRSRGDGN